MGRKRKKQKTILPVATAIAAIIASILCLAFMVCEIIQKNPKESPGPDASGTEIIAITGDDIPVMATASLIRNTEMEKTWEQNLTLTMQDGELVIDNPSPTINARYADEYHYEIVLYCPALIGAGASYPDFDKVQYVEIQHQLYDYTLARTNVQTQVFNRTITPDRNKKIIIQKKDRVLRVPIPSFSHKVRWFDVTAVRTDGTLHTARILASDMSAAEALYKQVWPEFIGVKPEMEP